MSGRRFAVRTRRGVGVAARCASCANKTAFDARRPPPTSGLHGSSMAGMSRRHRARARTPAAERRRDQADPDPAAGVATWQGMKISARAMTAVPFVIFNGTSEQMVKPGPKTSFHLMVMLNDAQTGVAIPYASVWATISQRRQDRLRRAPVADDLAYMGPHYGNDVSAPGAGHLPAEPADQPAGVGAARRVPERVAEAAPGAASRFHWKPVS